MGKPPRQLIKQVELLEEVIGSLNILIDTNKVKVDYYGKDFMEPLNKLRSKALELRGELEVFKNDMEAALTVQYGGGGNRFANQAERVIEQYLQRGSE